MASDRGLLVCGDDADLDFAVGSADASGIGVVRGRVQSHAEPGQSVANLGADRRRAFSDPRGEHEAIEPAQRACQPRDLESDAIGEEIERLARVWVVAGDQHAHVAADPGDAQQSGTPVEHVLDLVEALALPRQIENDAGVERAAARRHDQAVEHAERHGRGDADAALQRAEAGAGAQMRGDDPSSASAGA